MSQSAAPRQRLLSSYQFQIGNSGDPFEFSARVIAYTPTDALKKVRSLINDMRVNDDNVDRSNAGDFVQILVNSAHVRLAHIVDEDYVICSTCCEIAIGKTGNARFCWRHAPSTDDSSSSDE